MGRIKFFLEESKRIRTLHHVTNFILVSVFYFTKVIEPLCHWVYKGKHKCHIENREHEILLFLMAIVFWKNRKASTWIHMLSNFFMFAKIASLLLFYRLSPAGSLLYGVLCLVQAVVFPEPVYSGPENVTYFRASSLHEEIERSKKVTWMVEFFASWSPECRQFTPVFAKLSERYSLPNLKFAKLDVGTYTKEAERFRINAHPTSRQLPTISLFQEGKETKRRPLVDKNGRAARYVFSEENLIFDFDINNLYEGCKQNLSKEDKKAMSEAESKKSK